MLSHLSKRARIFVILALIFFIASPLYSMSINYKRPPLPFDSDVRLYAFDNFDNEEQEYWNFSSASTSIPRSKLPKVYVQFLGPTNLIYQQFGHVGIILDFDNYGRLSFDYGVFDASQPKFLYNFVNGDLYYSLFCHDSEDISIYKNEGRKCNIYLMDMTAEEKLALVDFLEYNAKPENQQYLYNFITDNCSTRVRDILDTVYHGYLSEYFSMIQCGTYRGVLERAVRSYPYLEAPYNILLGNIGEKKISYYDAFFLPEYLEYGIAELGIGNLVESEPYPVMYPSSFKKDSFLGPNYLLYSYFLIPLLLIILVLGRLGSRVVFYHSLLGVVTFTVEFALGTLGLVSLFLSSFTIHTLAWHNYNLILLNPLMICSAFFSLIFALNPRRLAKIYTDIHKILSSFVVIAIVLKLFYIQKNLYLILFLILYYHFIISSFTVYNGKIELKPIASVIGNMFSNISKTNSLLRSLFKIKKR